jgi:hypothetical protein
MNSLPLISHRLFVAAIGNESRAHGRPRRLEKPSAEVAEQAALVAILAANQARPTINGGFRPFQASASQVRV